MFFDEYPKEKLSQMWSEFAKTKRDYTPEERWKEVIDSKYRNAAFAALSMDNIIYSFYKDTYNEDSEKTCVPCVCTSMMIILAKKATIDYNVEMNIPAYEFTTYFETTRLESLFERTRDVSELHDEFKKYEGKLNELFPEEETTLWKLFNDEEKSKQFDELCDNNDGFGIGFIDVFTNMLVYDFVKNYLQLPNERNLNDLYSDDDEDYEICEEGDCCETEDVCCDGSSYHYDDQSPCCEDSCGDLSAWRESDGGY